MAELKRIVEEIYPRASERFNQNEVALKQIESFSESLETTFGGPTNRDINEGYWSSPKSTTFGEISLKQGVESWRGAKPSDVVCPENVVCTNVTHCPGYHGGYVTVQLKRKENTNE